MNTHLRTLAQVFFRCLPLSSSHRTHQAALSLMMLLVSAIACTDPVRTVGPTTREIHPALTISAQPVHRLRTMDDAFDSLTSTVAGFGGLFYDSTGRLNVYLTSRRPSDAAKHGLAKFLSNGNSLVIPDKERQVATMNVLQAKYDYHTLMVAYRQVMSLLSDPGVTLTDIDEAKNRVVIGVVDTDSRSKIARALAASRLADVTRIEIIAPITVMGKADRPRSSGGLMSPACVGCGGGGGPTLQGEVRPVPASVIIESAVEYCSIGWNAYYRDAFGTYDGAKYFITASHCSSQKWALDNTVFGQGTSPIADEVADPPPFFNATNADCPLNYRCRYSDAVLARYRPGIAWRHGVIPIINNTPPFPINGYTNITGTDPRWGTAPPSIYVGLSLRKTGQATGMSPGTLRRTCVGIHRYEHTVSTDEWLICQFQANDLYNDYGDSGAAVYHPNSAGQADPIMGVLWGWQYDNNVYGTPVVSTFSHAWYVTWELSNAWGGGWLDAGYGSCGQCGY